MITTDAQRAAIEAKGNVLVAAGAGAGKTSTLVERCVRLIDEGCSLKNILMVTFTEAAAAEMRERIRKALEGKAETNPRLEEELALLDTAQISTLHSFCFKLVRRHFHELELDPQSSVLDDAQGVVLMEETLDELLRRHYTGEGKLGGAIEELIQAYANGREEPIRELVLKIHRYTQTQPNPKAWIDAQLVSLKDREPIAWRLWLLKALRDWRGRWREPLHAQPSDHVTAHQIVVQLDALGEDATLKDFAPVLETVPDPRDLKPKFRKPSEFFEEARFLRSVTVARDGIDPLAQDWEWSRAGMETLLLLAREFAEAFAAAKREQAALDFTDLEQFALRLLWDAGSETATALGREYREHFHHVFVDECQDINAAQDAIIRAISRESGNRFLVGDVKQSIYRFRLADPRIFQSYQSRWRTGSEGQVISLSDNFRSREVLLDFFNAVFADLMQPEIGRVQFDENAKLRFGLSEERRALTTAADSGPRVHLHLRLTSSAKTAGEPENESELAELTGAEHEARIVANRLRELREQHHQVMVKGEQRDVSWGDMAVLLRSPAAKAEIYAREFARQNIPLEVAQNDFFDALEITDLLSVLMLLDNPLQDVPLLAVLHSPLAGLAPDELAEVRLASRGGYFWTALNRFHQVGQLSPAWPKVDQFLERFARWRRMGRDASIGQRLEGILAETHYLDWLAAYASNPQRAEQRMSNVRRLLTLARQFDPFQRQGVQRFLRFVEAQRAVTAREPIGSSGAAVQLISIHRSKGLEYPVVVVPDLGKRFNFSDLSENILLHERFGLCPRIKPPHTGQRYPSLTHWLYGKHERSEMLGEEMRLLYVAMTRAKDTLLLVGTATRKRCEEAWPEASSSPDNLRAANSMLNWLGPWFTRHGMDCSAQSSCETGLFSWKIYSDEPDVLPMSNDGGSTESVPHEVVFDFAAHKQTLSWISPFRATTHETAKTSVSALRRKFSDVEEARPWRRVGLTTPSREGKLSAAEIGTAHHTFMECADLRRLTSEGEVAAEAERLVQDGALSAEEAKALNVHGLAQFWNSDVGQKLLAELPHLRRELPFTARFAAHDLRDLGLPTDELPATEFVIVQGVADLAAILPKEIWLLDFKTDEVTHESLADKEKFYAPQLNAYSAALARIYARPVTRRWLHFLNLGVTRDM